MTNYALNIDGADVGFHSIPSSSLWPAGDPCPSDGEVTVFQNRAGDEMWGRFMAEKGGQ